MGKSIKRETDVMTSEKYGVELSDHADSMVFGFDRATDERSMAVFLQKMAGPELLAALVPRLEDNEIETVVQLFTGLMKKHLRGKEFHRLFLGEHQ